MVYGCHEGVCKVLWARLRCIAFFRQPAGLPGPSGRRGPCWHPRKWLELLEQITLGVTRVGGSLSGNYRVGCPASFDAKHAGVIAAVKYKARYRARGLRPSLTSAPPPPVARHCSEASSLLWQDQTSRRPCIIGFSSAGPIEPGRHLVRACRPTCAESVSLLRGNQGDTSSHSDCRATGQLNRGLGFPARGAVIGSLVDGFRLGLKIFGPLAELFSNVVPDSDAL